MNAIHYKSRVSSLYKHKQGHELNLIIYDQASLSLIKPALFTLTGSWSWNNIMQ